MEKYQKRADVPAKYKWDLSDFVADEKEVPKILKELEEELAKYEGFHGCTKDSTKLFNYLEFDVNYCAKLMDLICFCYTKSDEDLGVAKNAENLALVESLNSKYDYHNSFFVPELLALTNEDYLKLFQDKKLAKYRQYLDNIYRYKEHHLTEDEEKLVSQLTENVSSFGNASSTLLNSNHDYGYVTLSDGTKEELRTTNYTKIMKGLDRSKRKKTYLQFHKVLDQYSSTSASFLNNYVKANNTIAKIHHFDSAWDKKLFDLQLSNDVFEALKSGVLDNLAVIKKYRKIKAKNIGVSKLMPWDAPLEFYNKEKEYSIEEANELVLKAMSVLGEDYLNHLKLTLNGGNIDYCGYKGKCSGGYNISSINQKNSKILMSFNYDLASVSTIAHEAGHHVHNQYIYENNDLIYRDHYITVAEIASLTNECLLSSYLMNSTDKEEALSGISNIISVIRSNLVGSVMEGSIEQRMYEHVNEGYSLTNDYLKEITEEELKKYYGKTKLEHDYQKNGWIRRSHYYMNFYLYNYAICVSVAAYLAKNILTGDEKLKANYLKFLKCGANLTIEETFKVLNIDLKDKKIYQGAMEYLDLLLDKFEEIKEVK